MGTSRTPHFDSTNFPYYSSRMTYYLKTIDLGVWRVTHDRMKHLKNVKKPTRSDEKKIYLNTRAKDCLFAYFSLEIFNQVFTLTKAIEIWLKLHELYNRTSNLYEQKHCLTELSYDSFQMKEK